AGTTSTPGSETSRGRGGRARGSIWIGTEQSSTLLVGPAPSRSRAVSLRPSWRSDVHGAFHVCSDLHASCPATRAVSANSRRRGACGAAVAPGGVRGERNRRAAPPFCVTALCGRDELRCFIGSFVEHRRRLRRSRGGRQRRSSSRPDRTPHGQGGR